jgi:antitoxin MazE
MKIDIVPIGNSRGIRLPKAVIEQCGFGDAVDLVVEAGRVILSPAATPRAGWAEAFAAMAGAGDDAPLMDEEAPNLWDEVEWRW